MSFFWPFLGRWKAPLVKLNNDLVSMEVVGHGKRSVLLSKSAPIRIHVLLHDEMIKVKVLVKLICFGSGVTEEPLLIQFFSSLFE